MRVLDRLSVLPISRKILLAIIVTSMVVVVLITSVNVVYGWFDLKARAKNELSATASIFANNVSAALTFRDELAAEQLLESLKAMPQLDQACIYERAELNFPLFAQYRALNPSNPCPPVLDKVPEQMPGYILETQEVVAGDERVGYVFLSRSTADLSAAMRTTSTISLGMVVVSCFIAVVFSTFFRRLIEDPIHRLVAVTREVSSGGDFGIRAEKFAGDEIGTLFDSFNAMLEQIQTRDDDLKKARLELEQRVAETEQANATLNATLTRLKETQDQLVHQEKMASLGSLVAGVAHEINTPIGVGVTAASTLQGATEETSAAYENGKLTDSGLRKFMGTATQSASILLTNLNRAASLIQSFKQVAVDQTSSEVRTFNLRDYLDEVFLSLRPKLKKTHLEVSLNVPEELNLYSYPGALSQIVTNFVMNSLVHGYPDSTSGELSVVVEDLGEEIILHYRDDGVGINTTDLQRVFDPFFTTRRGAGGSGLGMHIVYNLVTQQLNGIIKLESEPGKGVHAMIRMPKTVSVKEAAV
ncbi:ATP-binding protein [Litorivivens sp.]|uniref:ATP-binding protein n=2 Tax=Litorivivens sp. TaxID=2020868 RepID=UPI00356835FA